jgi:exonuclease III
MDMRFGTWNVRSLSSAGSLVTVSNELSKCKLDLVGVQKVRLKGSGTKQAGIYVSTKSGIKIVN